MPTLQLSNTADQVNTTLSSFYDRLVGNYIGPQNASQVATAGFLIQNGNKGQGIYVANSGTVFFTNNLNFDPANTDLTINIPDTKNFTVTGNGAVLKFNGNGTLSVGQDVDVAYKGLQVFNSCPGIVLKDSDAINGCGCQFIRFIDSNGLNHTSILNERRTIGCYPGSAVYNTLNIDTQCILRFGNPTGAILVAKDNKLTIFAGDHIDPNYHVYVGSNMFVRSGFVASGITSYSSINSYSNQNIQYTSGNFVGTLNINRAPGVQVIHFANTGEYCHTSIEVRQFLHGGSYMEFYTSPLGVYNANRGTLAMRIESDKKISMQGDVCAYQSCFTSVKTNALCNAGGRTYLGADAASYHWIRTELSSVLGQTEPDGLGYGFGTFNGCVTEHAWNYHPVGGGPNARSMRLTSPGGLVVCDQISTCCRFVSSGSLNVSNINCCSCMCQCCISLFGYSTTGPSISISGATCFSGFANFNCNVRASSFSGSDPAAISCIQGTLCANVLCVPASISASSNAFSVSPRITAVNGLTSTLASICARIFCQGPESPLTNCFIEGLDLGVNCDKIINSKNTARVWGTACFRNGWVTNNSEVASFHNVSFIGGSSWVSQGVYGIVLKNPIMAPFSASFSTRALSFLPWATGSGILNFNDGFSNNGIPPFTAHLYTYAGLANGGALQLITPGNSYSTLYFTMTDNNLYQTSWNTMVNSYVSNLPVLNNPNLVLANCSSVTRVNYLKGAVDFSIYSCR